MKKMIYNYCALNLRWSSWIIGGLFGLILFELVTIRILWNIWDRLVTVSLNSLGMHFSPYKNLLDTFTIYNFYYSYPSLAVILLFLVPCLVFFTAGALFAVITENINYKLQNRSLMIRLGLIFTVFCVVSTITALPFGTISVGWVSLPMFMYINLPIALLFLFSELGSALNDVLPRLFYYFIYFLISATVYLLVGGAIGLLIDSIRENNREHVKAKRSDSASFN